MARNSMAAISSNNQQWLERQYDPDQYGLAVAVNHTVSTHQQVLENSIPAMKLHDWLAIFDVVNGHMVGPADHPAQLPGRVAECLEYEGLADRFDVGQDFVERLAALSVAELAAIEWVARRFWVGNWDGVSDYGAIMAALGVEVLP